MVVDHCIICGVIMGCSLFIFYVIIIESQNRLKLTSVDCCKLPVPLILGISMSIFILYLRCYSLSFKIPWALSLVLLFFCLFMTSLSNPGIALRYSEQREGDWIWNDQAITFRAPDAKYDSVCGVVIEGFDHVCPWVGKLSA